MLFAHVELKVAYPCSDMFGISVDVGDEVGRRKEEEGGGPVYCFRIVYVSPH